jgi:hypothetical protein
MLEKSHDCDNRDLQLVLSDITCDALDKLLCRSTALRYHTPCELGGTCLRSTAHQRLQLPPNVAASQQKTD